LAFESLRLGPKLAIIDEALFSYFVSNLDHTAFKDLFLKKTEQKHPRNDYWTEFLGNLLSSTFYRRKGEVTVLLEHYLTLICQKNNGSLDSVKELNFRKAVIMKIVRETRILMAKDGLESLDDVGVSPAQFKDV